MQKECLNCGQVFETEYPTKLYCSLKCANSAYYKRESSEHRFAPEVSEPLYVFECKNCGKKVEVYSRYDQRTTYCCGRCAAAYQSYRAKLRLAKQKHRTNLGMSGGMSLGILRRRESRSVDKEEVVYVNNCPECGKRFETKKGNQKYCSAVCQMRAEKARWRRRNATYRRCVDEQPGSGGSVQEGAR